MQIINLLNKASRELSEAGINNPRLDARIIFQHVSKLPQEVIYLSPELEISKEIITEYFKLISKRSKHEPVAKIIGSKSFWISDFAVNSSTLDPRPDSEVIIEAALKILIERDGKFRFLDLGTGSGCLLISLLQEFTNATGIGVDVSKEALEMALHNVKQHDLSNRVDLLNQNWADGITEKFDLIVSNPPYIPRDDIITLKEDVKFYDPMLALDGGIDGLDPYRYLAKQIKYILKKDAFAIFEFGFEQGEAIRSIFQESGYIVERMLFDLNNIERAIIIKKIS